MDKGTVLGIVVAFGGIIAGLVLEGGKVGQILQPTAALIVFGGTIGAVLLQFPLSVAIRALVQTRKVLLSQPHVLEPTIAQLVGFANKARRSGIVSLDLELGGIEDVVLKKALMLAVDGTEPQELRKIMEVDLVCRSEQDDELPKVFESAGGFAPTIGIVGAVLGLIQVMQHLDNINEVGKGIAVAFVATIYGVASANLLFLPAAGKLRTRLRGEQIMREMTVEGVISILEGMNVRMLEIKLNGFLEQSHSRSKADPRRVSVAAAD